MINDLAWDAQRKGLSIHSELEPCSVLGDEAQLKQVVWNTMSSAIRFTPPGAIFVSVRHDANTANLSVLAASMGALMLSINLASAADRRPRTSISSHVQCRQPKCIALGFFAGR